MESDNLQIVLDSIDNLITSIENMDNSQLISCLRLKFIYKLASFGSIIHAIIKNKKDEIEEKINREKLSGKSIAI